MTTYSEVAVVPSREIYISRDLFPNFFGYGSADFFAGFLSNSHVWFMERGCSTSGVLKTRTKRSLSAKRKLGDLAAAAHLQSTSGTVLRNMVTTSGRVRGLSARSGGQVLKQERVPQRRHSDTAWVVLTKLRVNLGLTIATMAE